MAEYTKDNVYEIPNKKPVELPIGYEHPESLEDMISRMVRVHSNIAQAAGEETLEESDDFDGDDDNILGDHQFTDMEEEVLHVPIKDRYRQRDKTVKKDNDTTKAVEEKPVVGVVVEKSKSVA